mgnify:CR=1 FL=1
MSEDVYKVGQEGVNTIYKALKCLLNDNYREIEITHKDKQTARAIINEIDTRRKLRVADSELNGNRLGS